VVVLDNARTVVAQADPCGARLSGRFVAYAQERGFVVDATRVRRPQDKAKVERTVQYVQRSFWQGESFRSLQEGQEAAEKWCRDVAGRRIHGTTRKRPVEVFEAEEKALLLPAPESRYDLPSFLHVTVQRDHHVTADRALYSVPTAYIGEEVTVRLDRELVRIYHRGKLIKTHPRQPPGGRSTDEGTTPPRSQPTRCGTRTRWRRRRAERERTWAGTRNASSRGRYRGRGCGRCTVCSASWSGTDAPGWTRPARAPWTSTLWT